MKQYGPKEPLTYANAPRETIDGIEYLTDEAALALMMQIAEEDEDLVEALAQQ